MYYETMLGYSVPELLQVLTMWGYPVVFLAAVIEGPVVMMLGGALVSFAGFDPFLMLAVLVLADLVGDALYYAAGLWGHGPIGRHIARWIGVTDERHEKIEQAFRMYGGKILLFTKTQPIGSVALYMAGAVRMPFWPFIWYNLIGTLPKTALFEAVGYYFGTSYMHFERYLTYTGAAAMLVSLLLLGLYFLFRRYVGRTLGVR